MVMSGYMLAGIVVISVMVGFWTGRSIRWMAIETEENIAGIQAQEEEGLAKSVSKKKRVETEQIHAGRAIGSPATGEVRVYCEGGQKGVWLRPEQDGLYAPAGGKVIKLYPMGNAMLFRTDYGVELMLRVGDVKDEMFSEYYRANVIQNEIVNKGRLLLEFDREGLQKAGIEPAVILTVPATDGEREVTVTQKEKVKTGEELIWVLDI